MSKVDVTGFISSVVQQSWWIANRNYEGPRTHPFECGTAINWVPLQCGTVLKWDIWGNLK